MAGDDFEFLTKEVILPEIRKLGEKMDKANECMVKLKLSDQKTQGKIEALEKENKQQWAVVFSHTKDQKIHYNPHYNETNWEKVKRKKVEIGVATVGGVSLSSVIYLAIEIIKVLRGG